MLKETEFMEFQNGPIEASQSALPQQQENPPPKWLSVIFKIWGILGFFILGIIVIAIALKLKSQIKIITELTEISVSYSLILYGLYAVAFVLILVYLIPFFGAFKLRKWLLPILIILSLFSVIDLFSIFFLNSSQLSSNSIFQIIWNLAIITLAVLAFVFKSYFSGKYRKLSLQLIFFIFTIPILAIGTLSLLFPDLPDINDTDLTKNNFARPIREQNSYYTLIEISEQVYEPTGQANDRYKQFYEGRAWDQTEADFILNKNKNTLEAIRKAATLFYYQCPSYAENISPSAELCAMNYLRASGRVASLSALSRAGQGDFQGAIDDALVPVRIGQLMIDEPSITLIDYLVGDAMKRIGLNTLQIIITRYQIPSEMLLPRIAELQKYTQNEKGLKNAFRLEYQSGKNSIAFVNKINSDFYIQPNRFFTEMAEDTRQKMAITDTPCYKLETTLKEYQEKIPKIVIWKLPFTRNALFEVLKSVILVDLSSTQNKKCESDLLVEKTRLQVAMSAYKQDNGQFPTSQTELIPNYITKVVLNPSTNKEFTFNKETGRIDQ